MEFSLDYDAVFGEKSHDYVHSLSWVFKSCLRTEKESEENVIVILINCKSCFVRFETPSRVLAFIDIKITLIF